MSNFDWATLIAGAMGAAATSFGLIFAGRQIRLSTRQQDESERWRRVEFAIKLIERLNTDEELAFCARALDWGGGPLIIPTKYRPLGRIKMPLDWRKLAESMRPSVTIDQNDHDALIYRYSFDALGNFLETVSYHITLENVDRTHLIGLKYYLNLVAEAPYYEMLPEENKLPNINGRNVFRDFLKEYYPAALQLVEERHLLPLVRRE